MDVVSLFSGCGGLDIGAIRAGFKVRLALDNDKAALTTYANNLGGEAILHDINNHKNLTFPKNIDLLIGGPPCQGFSSAGPKKEDDPRNVLWKSYLEILIKSNARAFLLENVPGFEKQLPFFLDELNKLAPNKYRIEHRKLVSQFYGVPQFRHRLFVIGVPLNKKHEDLWPTPTSPEFFNYTKKFDTMLTLRDAIQDLGPPSPIGKDAECNEKGRDHIFLPLSEKEAYIASRIPNGGSLKDIPDQELPKPYYGRVRGPKGWTWYFRKPRLELPARSVIASIRPNFSTVLAPDIEYQKRDGSWFINEVNKDLYTNETGLYLSPVNPRRLTVREYARIQTFPDDFIFSGTIIEKYKQIGNAVPCELATRLCTQIATILKSSKD